MIDIDPMVDFACKMVLGNPAHSGLTVHFLNSVLRLPSPIVQVEHLNPIVPPKFETDKLSVLDILALDDQGRRYNIEVQRRIENSLQERLAYYAATQLVDQISRGQGYRELQPSIGIC
ncbi:MAG: Rpn family recombination-promoting nuclease/putative transposase, partial [Planctomycetia bacterium]